jgi:hypothetical protein
LPRTRWHSLARSSSAASAFTSLALLGRGAGVVSIHWLIRNKGLLLSPRLGLQENSGAHERCKAFLASSRRPGGTR